MKHHDSSFSNRNQMINEQLKLRNIDHLLHFTNTKNIKNILDFGILPVAMHSINDINSYTNDKLRSDELTDTTSFSIEFPNYKMFYKLRAENPAEDWVILFVKAKVLLSKECVFCYDNASNPKIKEIPLNERMQGVMFKKMFDDIEGYVTRSERKLKRYFPTLSQAEVLIYGAIEVDYIDKFVFKDSETKNRYQHLIPNSIKCEVIPNYFYTREDHEYEDK